jgi:hypothetical protein
VEFFNSTGWALLGQVNYFRLDCHLGTFIGDRSPSSTRVYEVSEDFSNNVTSTLLEVFGQDEGALTFALHEKHAPPVAGSGEIRCKRVGIVLQYEYWCEPASLKVVVLDSRADSASESTR